MAAALFIIFLAAVVLGIPICFSLLISASVSLIAFSDTPMVFIIQKIFTSLDSFSMMAIPFFMIAGGLFDKGGVSKRLVDFANSLVGWLPGGLAIVTFVASAFFGAISGSASATVAAIGSIMLPFLLKEGYSLKFSLATIASAGFLGIIIPPSIPMVIYSIAASTNVGDVFTGGFIPGIMLVVAMSVYALIYGRKHIKVTRKFDIREVWRTFKGAIWALIMPVIILGGIYGGIFTPTEAAGVACVYGLFVGFVVYRELNLKKLFEIMKSAVSSTSMIMMIIACATVFATVLTREMIPQMICKWIMNVAQNQLQFMAMVLVLLFIVGMFLDAAPAVMILTPILTPAIEAFGISKVAFGVIMIVNLGIGLVTPPVGMNLYVAASLKKAGVEDVVCKHLWCYILCCLVVLALLVLFPGIVTFLPNLMK